MENNSREKEYAADQEPVYTIEELRASGDFDDLSDEQATELIEGLEVLAGIVYAYLQKKNDEL